MRLATSAWLGDYQVVRLLGAGGMGEVYLVTERAGGREWALKTMDGAKPDSELWQRFVNEGRVLSELSHRGIAAFHDMFQVDARPCLVMEYVDGETLYDRIRRLGRLTVEDTLTILKQVLEALDYLHRKSVMHRDLKSANIKISSGGNVKLLDFGIAKLKRVPGITVVGSMMGTPDYLSPEQVQGASADLRSEIWMVGLLAYEMLTGRLPFEGATDLDLYQAIRNETPAPPSTSNTLVPPAVDRIVLRCLEKNPARRFQSPAALLNAIEGVTASASGNLHSLAARISRLPRRTLFGIGGAAVVLLFSWWIFEGTPASGDTRTITVDVVEGRAEVYESGTRVGRTPYRVRAHVGDPVQLELRRAGYVDQPVLFEVTERNVYSYAMQPASGGR